MMAQALDRRDLPGPDDPEPQSDQAPGPRRLGPAGYSLTPQASEALARAMTARGMDQQALADAAGVARSTVTNVLHGKKVGPQVLTRIARALGNVKPDPGVMALLKGEID